MRFLAIIALAILLPACATDSDALLNDQNIEAGDYIEKNAVQPNIKQAGKDVKLNAQTLAKNAVGDAKPELKKPYSPENSKAFRDDSDKSHTSKIWPWISAGLALLLPVVLGIARAHPWGAVVANLAEPYIKTLITVHNSAEDHPEDMIHRDTISDHINDLLSDPKTGLVVAKLITKVGLENEIQPG